MAAMPHDKPLRPTEDADTALTLALDQLRAERGAAPRDQVLGIFRRHLARVQIMIREEFETYRMAGVEAAGRLTALTDGVVRALFEHARAEIGAASHLPDQISIAATGGYGRCMLAPFSDIDLLFLAPDEPSPVTLRVIEFMLYFMWDLGLKVGHATRSVAHCLADADADLTIRTSLLDARLLAGDAALFDGFQIAFNAAQAQAGPGAFIAAKQAERTAPPPLRRERLPRRAQHKGRPRRPARPADAVLDGSRGLRAVHAARAAGRPFDLLDAQERRRLRRSWDFLWTVRFHMHYVAGRAEDRLTFDLQPVVGARMGYTRHGRQDGVERFMRHYFLTARDVTRLTRVVEPAIIRTTAGEPALQAEPDRALLEAGFVLADGMIMPLRGEDFETRAGSHAAHAQAGARPQLRLHPLALRSLIRHERRAVALRGDAEAGALFLDLLCGQDPDGKPDGAVWLNTLNESGIIGRLLPDWARIVGQMQFDTYHIFTVDEHTIEAVRILNAMERGKLLEVAPVASGLLEDLQSRRSLYMAHAVARYRQGARRRSFHPRRGRGHAGRPATGPDRGGDRNRILAGAAPSSAEPDRVQARHRRSENHHGPGRDGAIARAAEAAAGADRGRHARRIAARVEWLEGDAAARDLRARCRSARRRLVHDRARRARQACAHGRRGGADRPRLA